MFCPWEPAQYLFFSSNVPPLFYYSHGVSLLFALVFGFILLFKASGALSAKLFSVVTFLFSLWVLLDLHIWATNNPSQVMFFWSFIILIEVLVYLGSVYFIHVFNQKRDISFSKKMLMFLLVLPIVVTLHTTLNLSGIDVSYCDAEEGFIAKYYSYGVEIFSVLWVIFYAFKAYRTNNDINVKKQVLASTTGIIFFLLAFSFGNIFSSFSENWNYSQFGLFAMPILIGVLAYLVVKYNSFNVKVISTQLLVWALVIMVASQLFFAKTTLNFILAGVTSFLVLGFGFFLVKSVQKEVEQREELENLNNNLKSLIQQRESLVHLITHKVKGSFTRTKYVFAEMLNDTFGVLTPEMRKMAQTGLESDDTGIKTIDLVLNASNLQSGTVKYDMKNIDLKGVVDKMVAEQKISAETKNLKINTEIKQGPFVIKGDEFWLKEVIHNFIENSIKYTPSSGEIKVGLENKNGDILFSVRDNGIGLTSEDMSHLFTEGGRGKDSTKMNVDSTGYGLYSAKLIVDAHGGRVWAESDGKDKGSTFFAEFKAL